MFNPYTASRRFERLLNCGQRPIHTVYPKGEVVATIVYTRTGETVYKHGEEKPKENYPAE